MYIHSFPLSQNFRELTDQGSDETTDANPIVSRSQTAFLKRKKAVWLRETTNPIACAQGSGILAYEIGSQRSSTRDRSYKNGISPLAMVKMFDASMCWNFKGDPNKCPTCQAIVLHYFLYACIRAQSNMKFSIWIFLYDKYRIFEYSLGVSWWTCQVAVMFIAWYATLIQQRNKITWLLVYDQPFKVIFMHSAY